MRAVYCVTRGWAERVNRACEGIAAVRLTAVWTDFEMAAAASRGAVVAIESLASPDLLSRMRSLKGRYPLVPVVLVTAHDPANLRLLKDVIVDDVVFLTELDEQLPAALRAVTESGFLNGAAHAIERAVHVPEPLRSALALACRSKPPILTEKRLALLAGCSRVTLWRKWKTLSVSDKLSLDRFLRWITLLRIAEAADAEPHRSPTAIVETIGTTVGKLHRAARDLLGEQAGENRQVTSAIARRYFECEVLVELLSHQPSNRLGDP